MSLLHRTKLPRPPALHQVLLLPSSLRSRTFHASPRPQNVLLTAINASHTALDGLHSLTGLPWAYSIPLFALLLRCTIILPISIYQRRAILKQASLLPLLQSWRHALQHETMREVRAKRSELYSRHGCGMWKNFLMLVQLPVFLSVMEALRKMCGSREGVLGMLMGNQNNVVETGVENVAGVITGDGLVDQALSIPTEMSLATEGVLWFPNLLVGDPQLVLPFVLSATLLLNIFGLPTSKRPWSVRLKRSLGLVCLVVGPLMINVPSALLIYWISSSASAYLQALALENFMPIPKAVAPCEPKRPWRAGLGVQMSAVQSRIGGNWREVKKPVATERGPRK
ncbi:uncharacterized protein L3040_001263 [Drepanopeziza brunnea f. sp. 'multigermtubi']|uniref:Inner membrane protein COX18 n=1 Tax=Marssonina brunnea f. sp. multigermtubi (strain MB_m1) TaxID=1072389 RepID=K1WVM5_MARBU|nr:inner membrane protein COX18 [Drepanopeziza brunnea f. sp. 'multigermtubi' MB_m1]EKD16527.1 inner membrane protein COX18 [Drepanopeziza brunnea f. sp. 'multigermtubi' MB_m1]KAJ5051487.1 hypothetical protein L3040_001263 [Drepanopeziza brunnea f. sp. 'multigermtubi']